ncbi:unnamed protein product, partial [Notodromas monacha]
AITPSTEQQLTPTFDQGQTPTTSQSYSTDVTLESLQKQLQELARMQGNKSEEYQPEPLVKTGEESRAALEAQAHVRQAQLTGKANQQQPIAMSCQCSNPVCCLKMIKSQASLPKVGASTYVASVEPDRSECMIMTRDRGATPVQRNSRQSHVPSAVIPPASSHHVREIMTMKASNTSQQRSRENSFFKLEKVGQQRSSDQHSGVEKQAFSMASPMSMTVRALGKMRAPSPLGIPDVPSLPQNDPKFVTYQLNRLEMTKAQAHDNITTSNVPLSGFAYAFPRISGTVAGGLEGVKPAYGTGAPKFAYKGERLPPNCISIVPKH